MSDVTEFGSSWEAAEGAMQEIQSTMAEQLAAVNEVSDTISNGVDEARGVDRKSVV